MRLDHLLSKENYLLFNFESLLKLLKILIKEAVRPKECFERIGTNECEWKAAICEAF